MHPRIPVALFVYARPEHTRRTLAALRANRGAAETDLVVFSDAPARPELSAAVSAVREAVAAETGFRSCRLHARDTHRGLAESVIGGVSDMLAQHEAVIVMEDDLVTAPGFLDFMNLALRTYRDREDVMSVCGCHLPGMARRFPKAYPWPVWLSRRHLSHGWGTWADQWGRVDWSAADADALARDPACRAAFDAGGCDLSREMLRWRRDRPDLWAIRFSYAHFRHGAWSVVPRTGYVRNIGYDGSGENCMWNPLRRLPVRLGDRVPETLPADLQPDSDLLEGCRRVIHRRHILERLAGHALKFIRRSVAYGHFAADA